MRFLEPADVVAVALELAGGPPEALGNVNLAGLEAALVRARRSEPEDAAQAAARVFAEVARARPFASANRAVAWLAACQLLSLNGEVVPAGPEGLEPILADVAAGGDVDALTDWIRARCLPVGRAEKKGVAMFERFSDESREVLNRAREEANRMGHDFLGTEHLLLGVLCQEATTAAEALTRVGVTHEAVRDAVFELIGPGSGRLKHAPTFTPRTKKVLELSLREAQHCRAPRIEPEHIVLGIIREGSGVAAKVIEDLGVDLNALRRDLLRGGGTAPLATTEPRLRSIDLGSYRQRMLGDLDALTGRIRQLEAECDRLRGILRGHGIEPDGGERSA